MVAALSHFPHDEEVYRELVHNLREDSSYAVEAAAAKALGRSGRSQAFDILQAEVQTNPELHVMQATVMGLAETKDPRAIEILLAQSRPGVPEGIRIAALAEMGTLKGIFTRNQISELSEVVRAALHDPFFFTKEAAEQLVGIFRLTEFEADIESEARDAPMAMQRAPAKEVLRQLHPQ